jgi:hypothetical protein
MTPSPTPHQRPAPRAPLVHPPGNPALDAEALRQSIERLEAVLGR